MTKRIAFLTCFLLLYVMDSCDSQEPTMQTTDWVIKYFGGSSDFDQGLSVVQTTDGGHVLTGNKSSQDGDFSSSSNSGYDIFVIKNDSTGKNQWIKTFGGTGSDYGQSIIQTMDGGFALTGYAFSIDGDFKDLHKGLFDIFVLKISATGGKQWLMTVGGNGDDYGQSLAQTNDGSFVVTGRSNSTDGDFKDLNKGGDDIFILKISSSGEKQWLKSFGGSGLDWGNSIVSASDGGCALTGYYNSTDGDFTGLNKGHYDSFVIKLSSTGAIQWVKSYGGNDLDWGFSLAPTTSGGYVLTGYSYSLAKNLEGDIYIIAINAEGAEQWMTTYGGSSSERGYSIMQTQDGGYVLTGISSSNDGDFKGLHKGDDDMFAIKVGSSGELQWLKSFGGSQSEYGTSIVQTTDSHYVLVGYSSSTDGDFPGRKGRGSIIVIKIK